MLNVISELIFHPIHLGCLALISKLTVFTFLVHISSLVVSNLSMQVNKQKKKCSLGNL